jgi:mRNA-degrading endonuclease RelE of RelBE toxin-antitoxin system
MEQDPFLGDVQPLKGRKWKGFYRKRAGRYRIIFFPNHQDRIIEVSAIVPRTEKTYR